MAVFLSPVGGTAAQFFTNTGVVLTGGKLYTYAAGTTTPQTTYTTSSGGTARTNPIILDSAGRVGDGGEIWLTSGASYKFVLKDNTDVLIATYDNVTGINDTSVLLAYEAAIAASSGSSLVGYQPAGTGAVTTTVQAKLRQYVSVMDFGADPTGATNSTNAIQNAIATGKAVYFPTGIYACNVSINKRIVLFGDGSTASIIKPFVNTSPAMVYTYTAQSTPTLSYWNYHSEICNLGFKGTGTGATATGIGFSFGSGSPSTYVTSAEYANNVTFYNCLFSNLEKGVQFPFGNIGTAFYSCGFQLNYYGVYMLNNKSGFGDVMHAGNKYFYNGEFDNNVCAIYINNTAEGFGGINFTDTIIEYNNIGVYIYNTSPSFTPIQFNDSWIEGNGLLAPGGPSTVTIDVWTGNVKTTTTVGVCSFYLYNDVTLINGGFATGIDLKKDNARVYVKNSKVETDANYAGQTSSILYPDSNIYFENCLTSAGFFATGYSGNAQFTGINFSSKPSATDPLSTRASRFRYLPLSYAVTSSSGITGSSQTFVTAQAYSGASSGTGTVVSGGAPKYSTNNQFSFVFANTSQFYSPTATSTSISAPAWIAFTCDVNVTSASGLISIQLSDLNTIQAGIIYSGQENTWRTIGGVAYIPSNSTVALYIGTLAAQTISIQLSAFQLKKFASQGDAEAFLASRTYLN
jgi:hypothetical protein